MEQIPIRAAERRLSLLNQSGSGGKRASRWTCQRHSHTNTRCPSEGSRKFSWQQAHFCFRGRRAQTAAEGKLITFYFARRAPGRNSAVVTSLAK